MFLGPCMRAVQRKLKADGPPAWLTALIIGGCVPGKDVGNTKDLITALDKNIFEHVSCYECIPSGAYQTDGKFRAHHGLEAGLRA